MYVAEPRCEHDCRSLRQLVAAAGSRQRALADQAGIGATQRDVQAGLVTLDGETFAELMLRGQMQDRAHARRDVAGSWTILSLDETHER
jgi:hypothetical protein